MSNFAPLPLRAMVAIGFLYHGLPKFTGAGHQEFVGMLQAIGVPAPDLAAWLVGVVEVGGALLILAGAFTVIAATLLMINMVVAAVTVHMPNGFNFIHITGMTGQVPTFGMPGYEVNLLYISILLALALGGPGAMSFDAKR